MAHPTEALQAQVRKFTMGGINLKDLWHTVEIEALINAPFHKMTFTAMDNTDISKYVYEDGIPVHIVFGDTFGNVIRDFKFVTMGQGESSSLENGRAGGVTIRCITEEFYKLQENTSHAVKSMTRDGFMTGILHKLVSGGGLSVEGTLGLIGEKEPFLVSNKTVGSTIKSLLSEMVPAGGSAPSPFLYGKTLEGDHLCKSVIGMFTSGSPGIVFGQAVMGTKFPQDFSHNIYSYQTSPSDSKSSFPARSQEGGKPDDGVLNLMDGIYSAFKQASQLTGSVIPGRDMPWNGPTPKGALQSFLTIKNPLITNLAPFGKMAEVMQGAAQAPQNTLSATVPLAGGIKVDVGSTFIANMLSNPGDGQIGLSKQSGKYLAAGIKYELRNRENGGVNAWVTLTGMGGGQGTV